MIDRPFRKIKSFEIVTIANGISKIGNQFYYLAAPLYLLKETQSALLTALFLALQNVPYLMSSLIGMFIDRFNKRYLYIISESIQLIVMLMLAYLVMKGYVKFVVVLFSFLVFILQICSIASSIILEYSVLPKVSRDNNLTSWNSSYVTFMNSCRMLGPVIGGYIMQYTGEYIVLLINALTFFGTLGLGIFLPEFRIMSNVVSKRKQDLGILSYIFKTPSLIRLTFGLGIYNLGVGGLSVIIMALLKEHYNLSSINIGMAISLSGMAGILGTIWARKDKQKASEVYGKLKGWFCGCIAAAVVILIPNLYALYIGYFAISFCEGVINVFSMTYRQQIIPANLTGRLNGLIKTIIMGPIPVSFVIYGFLLSSFEQTWVSLFILFLFVSVSYSIINFYKENSNSNRGDGDIEYFNSYQDLT